MHYENSASFFKAGFCIYGLVALGTPVVQALETPQRPGFALVLHEQQATFV
jgi:hypothetical protein